MRQRRLRYPKPLRHQSPRREVMLSQQALSFLEAALSVFVQHQRARVAKLVSDPGYVARASALRIEAQLVLLTHVQWSLARVPISGDLYKDGNAGVPLRLSMMELAALAMAVQRLLHEPALHRFIAEHMRWPAEETSAVVQHLRLLRACLPTLPRLTVS
jgi:hypothetical protein